MDSPSRPKGFDLHGCAVEMSPSQCMIQVTPISPEITKHMRDSVEKAQTKIEQALGFEMTAPNTKNTNTTVDDLPPPIIHIPDDKKLIKIGYCKSSTIPETHKDEAKKNTNVCRNCKRKI